MLQLGWLSPEGRPSPWTYINVELSPLELTLPCELLAHAMDKFDEDFSEGLRLQAHSVVVNYSFGGYRQSVLKLI
eukprot:13334293-Ditylum_brightwellii.AAC.1